MQDQDEEFDKLTSTPSGKRKRRKLTEEDDTDEEEFDEDLLDDMDDDEEQPTKSIEVGGKNFTFSFA